MEDGQHGGNPVKRVKCTGVLETTDYEMECKKGDSRKQLVLASPVKGTEPQHHDKVRAGRWGGPPVRDPHHPSRSGGRLAPLASGYFSDYQASRWAALSICVS